MRSGGITLAGSYDHPSARLSSGQLGASRSGPVVAHRARSPSEDKTLPMAHPAGGSSDIHPARIEPGTPTDPADMLAAAEDAIVAATSEAEVYEALCGLVAAHLDLPMAWVGLIEPASRIVRRQASAGPSAAGLREPLFRADDSTPMGGLVTRVMRTGSTQTMLVPDPASADAAGLPRPRHGFRSAAAFPIRSGRSVVGAFVCASARPDTFDGAPLARVERLASLASTVLVFLERDRQLRDAEESMTVREQTFRLVFDHAPVAMMSGRDGRVDVNRAFSTLFGFEREAAPPASPDALVDPADVAGRRALGMAFATGRPGHSTIEASGRRADGAVFPLKVDRLEGPGGAAVTLLLTDAAPQRSAEAAARRRCAEFDSVLDAVPLALVEMDLRGHVKMLNHAAERLLGLTSSRVVGMPLAIGPVRGPSVRWLATGKRPPLVREPWPHPGHDGSHLDLLVSTARTTDADGRPSGLLVTLEAVRD
jgi:PAS domain S-box-containing protein